MIRLCFVKKALGPRVAGRPLKCGRSGKPRDKADYRRVNNDDRKRDCKKEDADESERRDSDHRVIPQSALADRKDGFENDRETAAFRPKKRATTTGT